VTIILLSGGMDSAALLVGANRPISEGLFIDYGQPARIQEAYAAERLCSRFKVPFKHMEVLWTRLGEMGDEPGVPGPRVVAGRNAVLLSLAANRCPQADAYEIWYGATRDDAREYPDCRPSFWRGLSKVFEEAYGVSIDAPLWDAGKSDVVAILRDHKVEPRETWSCYAPMFFGGVPCNTCDACRRRVAVGWV
jgi:7-cyano-7-deazaguanine synthase in queuosine biosynthesis